MTNLDTKLRNYERKYSQYFEMVEKFRKDRFKLSDLTMHEKLALGQYMENWENYLPILENDPTSRSVLGDIVQARMGLVALQYATLPIADLASVQPLNEQWGVIYYRRLVATTTRAGVTQGTTVANPAGLIYQNPDYYSEATTQSFPTVTAQQNYNLTLSGTPLLPRYVQITVGPAKAIDDGQGNILGTGVSGTINYATGALVLSITNASVNLGTHQIVVTYHQNLVESNSIPGFQWKLDSKVVYSQFFTISTQYSAVSEWLVKQRFDRVLSQDLVADAVAQINSTVLSLAIRKLREAAVSNGAPVVWDAAAPAGTSRAEHRITFNDAIEQSLTKIGDRSGYAGRSFIVVGAQGRVILGTLGLKPLVKTVTGPYLLGYWDGTPVYYAPQPILGQDEVLVGYRGTNWFESPVVYAPFMPVMTVEGPATPNPMLKNMAVAHAAAVEVVLPEFVERIQITNF